METTTTPEKPCFETVWAILQESAKQRDLDNNEFQELRKETELVKKETELINRRKIKHKQLVNEHDTKQLYENPKRIVLSDEEIIERVSNDMKDTLLL